MVLIKSNSRTLDQEFHRLIWFYRRNPVIAAKHLLSRNGKPVHLFPFQAAVLMKWWGKKFSHLTASRGGGKALAHGSTVLTPSGFVNIEDMQLGDQVVTPDGSITEVKGVFPQGEVPLYKVTFSDGREVECCDDHLWKVHGVKYQDYTGMTGLTSHSGWNVVRLEDLRKYFHADAEKHHTSLRVPLVEDIFSQKEKKNLRLHPYVLGALIGDGNYTHGAVGLTSADPFIADKVSRLAPEGTVFKKSKSAKYQYFLRGCNAGGKPVVRSILEELGCHGQRSWEKKIPTEYMDLNREQTLQIIQGLLDTDGTVCGRGFNRVSYTTTSIELAKQVQELIWKLGGICKLTPRTTSYTYKGEKKLGRESYRLYIRYKNKKELVSLPRKREKLSSEDQYTANLSLRIVDISLSRRDEATCITVDTEEGLFITDNYVVTHNSFLCSIFIALRLLLYPGERIGIFAPSYRQSKIIFKEFTKLVEESPLLKECIDKMPTEGNDMCQCILKRGPGNKPPGYVMALPVGTDGGKIRGLRFDIILIDECVQLPETIFDGVIFPMLATQLDPVASVMAAEEKQRQIDENPDIADSLMLEDDLAGAGGRYVSITSGYYQFNYWWPKLVNFWKDMQENGANSLYSLSFVPWNDLPAGFLNKSVVMNAMTNNPSHMFLTEWAAEWISDSEGAFPMSLLHEARDQTLVPYTHRDLVRHKGTEYVLGIDVARDKDSTAICVIELGHICKVVHIVEIVGGTKRYQEQAGIILDLVHKFNPKKIYLDAGGGHGSAIQDLLASPETLDVPPHLKSLKIISDEESLFTTGRRILTMCDFSNQFVADANNCVKLLLERGLLKLPNHPIEVMGQPDLKGNRKVVDLVQKLIDQTASIIITKTGVKELPRYDLPKRKASGDVIKLDQPRKDIYTSFILAGKCAYDLTYKPVEDLSVPDMGVITEIGVPNNLLTPGPGSDMINTGRLLTPSTSIITDTGYKGGFNKIRNGGIIIPRNGRRNRRNR